MVEPAGHVEVLNGSSHQNGVDNKNDTKHQKGNGIQHEAEARYESNVDDPFQHPHIPIAICSMAFRLPGGIATDDAFWDVLSNGKDMRSPIPPSRFNIHGYDTSLGDPCGMKMSHGYFLDHDLSRLDTSFFPTITPNEPANLDPQLRQLLEVTRECLENAGETEYSGKRVGCYIGAFSDEWSASVRMESQQVSHYAVAGLMDLFIANRISQSFDFKGPR